MRVYGFHKSILRIHSASHPNSVGNCVEVQFGFWFNLDFPLFDIRYHILA